MKKFWVTLVLLIGFMNIHANTYYVAPEGNDGASGTFDFPFRTINRAAMVAQTGDTVYVFEGVYRERVIPQSSGVTFLAEPGWKVFIKGSALWNPSWQAEGVGIFSATPADSLFDDIPSDFTDSHNPFRTPLSVSPFSILGAMETGGDKTLKFTLGQVFVNGEMYLEMGKRSLLAEEKQWCYDLETNHIYIIFGSLNPSEQKVEITVRRRVFAPLQETGINDITLDGFIIEHCGNQYPDRFQTKGFEQNAICGAVGVRNNNGWKIRNCLVRYAKTIGIDVITACNDCDGPEDILVESCYIMNNGQTGIFGRRTRNSVFRDNVIMHNNELRFGQTKPHAKSTAGFKGLGGFSNNRIERNYFADNSSHGLWFDLNASNNIMASNVFVDNNEDAFYVELGGEGFDKNFFVNNLVLGGNFRNSSIRYADCGGLTFLHNLIIDHPAGSGENIAGFYGKTFNQDRKTNGGYKYTVGNFSFFNNLFIDVDVPYGHPYPDHYSAPSRFDHNVYTGSENNRIFGIHAYCGSPWPYTTDQVVSKVHEDLGPDSPGISALKIGDFALMTFAEWQKFWQVHEVAADNNSYISQNSTASYNRETYTLTLTIDFDPALIGSINHTKAGKDFIDLPIPQNGKALPGPFQNLKEGINNYVVWKGIPILKSGQLPSSDVTSVPEKKTEDSDHPVISGIIQGHNEITISLLIKKTEKVAVEVYDISGRVITALLNDKVESGTHCLRWDRTSLPAGFYILSVKSKNAVDGQLFFIK